MKRWSLRIFIISAVAVAGVLLYLRNCTSIDIPFFGRISEGVIEFKVTPINPNHPLNSMINKEAEIKFKNNASVAEISATGMTSSFISDPNTKKFMSLVSIVFIGKNASVMDMNEIKKVNYNFPDYDVEETNEIKKIAGYKCHKAVLHFKDKKKKDLVVWYTREIKIANPNWANAYYKIDGVLMDYELEKFGMPLRFTATVVRKEAIDDKVFSIPADYRRVPNKQLEEIISSVTLNY